MKSSWLVQRLQKPTTSGILGLADNPFSFGGGLRNGGLSPEAMNLTRDIFSFDYMGAAEFEFGAVPKALQRMAGAKLAPFSFELAADLLVARSWNDKGPEPEGLAEVFVLCPAEDTSEVMTRIRAWAGGSGGTKESVNLSQSLRPVDEWDGRTVGWLELDNGFMFFTDRDMWQKTCALFGVECAVSS